MKKDFSLGRDAECSCRGWPHDYWERPECRKLIRITSSRYICRKCGTGITTNFAPCTNENCRNFGGNALSDCCGP